MTAAGVSPSIIAGNADYPPARELIIAAGLDAADETIRAVASVRPSEEGWRRWH
jgi:hypothetical protein